MLQAYIYGWVYRDEEGVVDGDILDEFQIWIQERFDVTSTQSWASIISFYSVDDYKAIDSFFELWDEFLKSKAST